MDGFNPRTHEGCDIPKTLHGAGTKVSIHAPTRGATISKIKRIKRKMFQSTHPRGVRHTHRHGSYICQEFQSTHPRGVRRQSISMIAESPLVSIHAPTRGATLKSLSCNIILLFQSTHPRGVRLNPVGHYLNYSSFNPRTHEGCDSEIVTGASIPPSFNPRTHEGCDCIFCKIQNINIQK